MWTIETEDGMGAAAAWTQNLIDNLRDGGSWMVPRSMAVYTFYKSRKVAVRANRDSAIDDVLTHMGWKLEDAH